MTTPYMGDEFMALSEPNVLLLDQAQWRIDEGPWKAVEEILRPDNLVRRELGLPDRIGVQPWIDPEPCSQLAEVQLRFTFRSAVAVAAPVLALEEAAQTRVCFDGKPVSNAATGWWVDEAIQTIALPPFEAGEHELVLCVPFHRKTNNENAFLLGDFGVRVFGRYAELIEPVRRLAFGDWTRQGLPFYVGNVTYWPRRSSHHPRETGEPPPITLPFPLHDRPTAAPLPASAGRYQTSQQRPWPADTR
jgi:hypothetical protein